MNRMLPTARETALATGIASTTGTDTCVGENRQQSRLIAELMRVARALWPTKTAAELAARTEVSQRTAERWLALKTGMSDENIQALVRCDEGLAFLEALFGEKQPAYWRDFKRSARRTNLRREIKALQKKQDELEDEE